MATVYLAEDLKHHRPVAIKVLRPELAAAIGAERFLREIEIAARLTHPHILPLHDSGEAEGASTQRLDLALRRLRLSLVATACHAPDQGRWRQWGRTGLGGEVPPGGALSTSPLVNPPTS